jgi:hypothetical protein
LAEGGYDAAVTKGRDMIVARVLAVAMTVCVVCACDRPMTTPEKGAVIGAAAGTGIGLVAGGSFGAVVGAGLIGGAVGYLGGTAIQNSR